MERKLPIKGFWPTSLIDWPRKLAAVIFVGGCNFRCAFCYNLELVLNPEKLPNLDEEEIIRKLKIRKNWLDGIVISGGEPTLHLGLEGFLRRIKELGFKVALETNGTNPTVLATLIKARLIDGLFMDLKGPLEKYTEVVNTKIDQEKIKASVALILKNRQIESEFRTTVVPKFLNKKDIEWLGRKLFPQKCPVALVLQQFQNQKTLDPSLKKISPYSEEQLKELQETALKYFQKVEIRGL